MLIQVIIAGGLLGLVSGFHCVGMCGALTFSLPFVNDKIKHKWLGIALYHLGRIGIYTLLGVIVGYAGKFFNIFGLQQKLSIVLGIAILTILVINKLNNTYLSFKFINQFTAGVQHFIIQQYNTISLSKLFLMGAANGLLPCGMVYFALTGALATGNVLHAGLFMLFFGLATLPLLLMISFFSVFINITARNVMKKLAPVFIAVMAILLIIRGLNLNIPYVSPQLKSNATAVSCH